MHTGTTVRAQSVELNGLFTEYRFYYAQRISGEDYGLAPISVSGLIICEKQVIFARRKNVTSNNGLWELVPSGTLDLSVARDDHSVDYRTKIQEEFEEETGLSASTHIDYVSSLGVIYDPNDRAYDIVCHLHLRDTTVEKLLAGLAKSDEYESPIAVPLPQLETWLAEQAGNVVQTSLGILKMWRL